MQCALGCLSCGLGWGELRRLRKPTPSPKSTLPTFLGSVCLHGALLSARWNLPRHPVSRHISTSLLPMLNLDRKWRRPVTGVRRASATPHLTALCSELRASLAYFRRALMDEDRWQSIILGEITVSSRLNQPRAPPPPFVWLGL